MTMRKKKEKTKTATAEFNKWIKSNFKKGEMVKISHSKKAFVARKVDSSLVFQYSVKDTHTT